MAIAREAAIEAQREAKAMATAMVATVKNMLKQQTLQTDGWSKAG